MGKEIKIPQGLSEPEWGEIGKTVYERSYSRVKEDGTRESWAETVLRVVNGNAAFVDEKFIEPYERTKLFHLLFSFKFLPGGRHLWATGTSRSFISNCFTAVFDPDDFSRHFTFTFARLMEGGGIGSSYSDMHFKKYRPISHEVELHIVCSPQHGDYEELQSELSTEYSDEWFGTSIIPDSREGWTEALEMVLRAHIDRNGEPLVLDVSQIRPKGSLLKSFGGTASGPLALLLLLKRTNQFLNSYQGRKPDWKLAMAIDHEIARAVVAGGNRRSSLLASKSWRDPEIIDFIDIKNTEDGTGNFWTMNISVEVDADFWKIHRKGKGKDYTYVNKLLDLISKGMARDGEPGLINRTKMEEGEWNGFFCSNPCLSGETRFPGPQGESQTIGRCQNMMVWDGSSWVSAYVTYSGIRPVVDLQLSDGRTIRCTPDHKFFIDGRQVEAKDTLGQTLDDLAEPLYDPALYSDELNAKIVLQGFVQGDGGWHKASNRWKYVYIGEDDSEILDLFEKAGWELEPGAVSKPWSYKIPSVVANEFELLECHETLPDRTLPEAFWSGDLALKRAFLRGLYSANGSVCGKRITLKSTCLGLIQGVQEALTYLGIGSYYATNKPAEVEFSNGVYTCRESYDLNIADTVSKRKFLRWVGVVQSEKMSKMKKIARATKAGRGHKTTVTAIQPRDPEPVYDFTMDYTHYGYSNMIKVANCGEIGMEPGEGCNLGSVNLSEFASDLPGMREAFRLATRFLLRATYSDYQDPRLKTVVERNRRLGVGLMGFHEWLVKNGCRFTEFPHHERLKKVLEEMAEVVRETAREYAHQLRIPEPIKTRCIAPTGTTSQLAGTSSGMQPIFYCYFIRRVRFSTLDEGKRKRLKELEKQGIDIEDDVYAPNTKVASFICRASIIDQADENLIEECTEVSLEDFLSVQSTLQSIWADNAISATANIRNDVTSGRVKKAILAYAPSLKGMTVMPMVTDRPQMPFERISKEDYEAAQVKMTGASAEECNNGTCGLLKPEGEE